MVLETLIGPFKEWDEQVEKGILTSHPTMPKLTDLFVFLFGLWGRGLVPLQRCVLNLLHDLTLFLETTIPKRADPDHKQMTSTNGPMGMRRRKLDPQEKAGLSKQVEDCSQVLCRVASIVYIRRWGYDAIVLDLEIRSFHCSPPSSMLRMYI